MGAIKRNIIIIIIIIIIIDWHGGETYVRQAVLGACRCIVLDAVSRSESTTLN